MSEQKRFDMEENETENKNKEKEVTIGDLKGVNYISNPNVGEKIEFKILKFVENPICKGTAKDGTNFNIGLENKNGELIRYDIHTDQGVYTIGSWEVFFKITNIMKELGKTKDFSLRIKRDYNGNHATTKIEELQKIMGFATLEETQNYQDIVKKMKKEQNLYTIEVIKENDN